MWVAALLFWLLNSGFWILLFMTALVERVPPERLTHLSSF